MFSSAKINKDGYKLLVIANRNRMIKNTNVWLDEIIYVHTMESHKAKESVEPKIVQ